MDDVIYLTEDFMPVEKDDPRMMMVKVRQPDGKIVFGFREGVQQNKLFHSGGEGSGFKGHSGRPGELGGSSKEKHMSEGQAIKTFQKVLRKTYPGGLVVFHESPGHVAESIREKGIISDYGVFGSIGKPPNFVLSPQKTLVYFEIPVKYYDNVSPDMIYFEDENISGEEMLLKEHNGVWGARISYQGDIPTSWIQWIKELG